MRVSNQLLRSRAARPLHGLEWLDLSHLDLVSVDRLELCPKLQSLSLRDNRIEAVPNFDCCPQLWKIDLANNRLRSLEGLCHFAAFGCLILSNNELEWNELQKIRHLHILDLALHGNPQLEMDVYYRMHVIDSLPLVWMLDGRIITSAERARVHQFFKDSAYSERPVRHKLPKKQFIPTAMKNISVTGLHGHRTDHMMRRFPQKTAQNVELDKRRLQYLTYNLQQEVNLEIKYKTRGKPKSSQLIENLMPCRKEDQERCNMLLLLLVASLEFAIPSAIIQQTLDVARLSKIEEIETMDVFMFSRETRCRVVSLLLSAVKIERDQNIDGGLYNRLYLGLYDLVSDLIRLANGDDITRYQDARKKFDSRKSGYRSLLASEVVQLLCIVPVFFDFIGKDPGVMDLVSVATKDSDIGEQIKALSWKIQSEGGGVNRIYQEVGNFLMHKAKDANANSLSNPVKPERLAEAWDSNYLAYRIEPSYIITSKRLVQVPPADQPHSATGNHRDTSFASSRSPQRAATALGIRTKDSVRTGARAKTARRKPMLNDRVEIGHQACGRLVALPETHVGLVQLDSVAAPRFQQADYSVLGGNQEGQFHYVNFKLMAWDGRRCRWTKVKALNGSQGNTHDGQQRRVSSESEGQAQFLSEALQQSLQLRADTPDMGAAEPSTSPPDLKYEGRTLITNHVRSIVRECLQEAELKWPDSESRKQMAEEAWVQPERTETPADSLEAAANVAAESYTDTREIGEERIEQSEIIVNSSDEEANDDKEEHEYPTMQSGVQPNSSLEEVPGEYYEHQIKPRMYQLDPNNNSIDALPRYEPDTSIPYAARDLYEADFIPDAAQYDMYRPHKPNTSPVDDRVHITSTTEDHAHVTMVTDDREGLEHEELISFTENARLDAWRSSEAMKRASSSCFPSRVGSATSRRNIQDHTPPPQRPTSPSHAGSVPVKSADRWLAGGRNVNALSQRHVSRPLPGWMEGLQEQRSRPQSSPVARANRRPLSSASAGSGIPRQNAALGVRPARGAAAVYVSGRAPPSYTRIQSARMVVRRQ